VLLDIVMKLKPHLHIFGRVHGCYGTVTIEPTIFANVAMLTEFREADRKPLQIAITLNAG
jgi:Icc-related predicted phosphoesterase